MRTLLALLNALLMTGSSAAAQSEKRPPTFYNAASMVVIMQFAPEMCGMSPADQKIGLRGNDLWMALNGLEKGEIYEAAEYAYRSDIKDEPKACDIAREWIGHSRELIETFE